MDIKVEKPQICNYMSEERWKCLEVPFCYVGMVYVCRYSKYHHKIWTNHKKKKKKKKKKPPALPYLKISCYSNTTIFFFGLMSTLDRDSYDTMMDRLANKHDGHNNYDTMLYYLFYSDWIWCD